MELKTFIYIYIFYAMLNKNDLFIVYNKVTMNIISYCYINLSL